MKIKSEAVRRFILGGLCGVVVMFLCAFFLELLASGIRGVFHMPVLVSHGAEARFGSYALAVLVQSALLFALGGMAGIATIPFAEDGMTLLKNSVLHFLVTSLFYSLLLVFCFDLIPDLLPAWLVILLALYAVIWLGRYVGWYVELLDIREKLGLTANPSPLKWKETLPYLPFLALLYLGLPILAQRCAAVGIPVLYPYLLFPFLIHPVGGFAAGFSLGKRQGFCPLYAVAVLFLFLLSFCLLSRLPDFTVSILVECILSAGCALLGNGLGALKRRLKHHA